MKFLNTILIAIILTSCSGSERFGLTQKYKCTEDEKTAPITEVLINKYEQTINIDSFNIPLNRLIESSKHKIYIGVSFNASKEKLYATYASKTDYHILNSRQSNDSIEFVFKKNDEFFYSLIYYSKKDKFTYVLTLESDSLYTNEKFNNYFLPQKVRNEK